MALSLLVALVLAPGRPFDFYTSGPYTEGVPRPEGLLGYEIGARTTTYREQELVVKGIAGKSSRVREFVYGKTAEGRPLRVFAVSSEENIRNLESIREENGKRALGQKVEGGPAIVWINECIHGNETASFEAAMPLLYNLAASQPLEATLKNVVVILNPVYNPDGHERFAVYYNSFATGAHTLGAFEFNEPSLIGGRTNHYRFDMNRDRVAMSQDETRQEVAEFLRWNPHVYVDQHGQTENYFFPPNPMAVHEGVDRARLAKWTDIFGRATASSFDRQGWTYFVRDAFDLFYPGYLDSWTSLSGAIGMTHETDGGRLLNSPRSDGSVVTLREGAEKHFTSALAVIRASSEKAADLIGDFTEFKRKAVSGEFAGKYKKVIVEGDKRSLTQIANLLARSGIESYRGLGGSTDVVPFGSDKKVTLETKHVFFLTIPLNQAQGPLAKALLEPNPGFEDQFTKEQMAKRATAPEGERYPGPEGSEFYDITAWSIPYAFNVRAYWSEESNNTRNSGGPIGGFPDGSSDPQSSADVGYAIPYTNYEDALAAIEALGAGLRGMVTRKPMTIDGKSFSGGTFIFLAARNEPGYAQKLQEIAGRRQCELRAFQSSYPDEGRQGPGTENVILLKKPKIGVIFGSGAEATDFGATWFLMEREFKLPFTPLSSGALSAEVLHDYTAIIVPERSRVSAAEGPLRTWVENGGTLVVLGSPGWAVGEKGFVKLDSASAEQSLPGALFQAQLDARSFLSFGYGADKDGKISLPVPVQGRSFYKVRKEGGSVVSFPALPVAPSTGPKSSVPVVPLLLSGWQWPDSDKALRGTVWLQDVPVGSGHAVLFTQDPLDRCLYPGLYKLVLNALLIGPSA